MHGTAGKSMARDDAGGRLTSLDRDSVQIHLEYPASIAHPAELPKPTVLPSARCASLPESASAASVLPVAHPPSRARLELACRLLHHLSATASSGPPAHAAPLLRCLLQTS